MIQLELKVSKLMAGRYQTCSVTFVDFLLPREADMLVQSEGS